MTRKFLRRSISSRAASLAVILLVHGAALALGLAMKGPSPDPVADAEPIVISLIAERRAFAPRPAPAPAPALVSVAPQPLTADFRITLPPDPPLETSPVAAPETAARVDAAAEISDGSGPTLVSDADYLQLPRVIYPPAARRARVQGLVHVRARVDEEGRPAEVSVARSSGFELLDGAACNAVRSARFKPYRRNNTAHSMVVIVPIEFSIRSRT